MNPRAAKGAARRIRNPVEADNGNARDIKYEILIAKKREEKLESLAGRRGGKLNVSRDRWINPGNERIILKYPWLD